MVTYKSGEDGKDTSRRHQTLTKTCHTIHVSRSTHCKEDIQQMPLKSGSNELR